jgi:hypothetical protein
MSCIKTAQPVISIVDGACSASSLHWFAHVSTLHARYCAGLELSILFPQSLIYSTRSVTSRSSASSQQEMSPASSQQEMSPANSQQEMSPASSQQELSPASSRQEMSRTSFHSHQGPADGILAVTSVTAEPKLVGISNAMNTAHRSQDSNHMQIFMSWAANQPDCGLSRITF